MTTVELLDALQNRAKRDPAIREALLATANETSPAEAFCRKCQELGYPIYAMDLIQAGKVKVNHSEVLDNDYTCRQEDLISCRGFGRIRVGVQSGETKKGKLKVTLIKYI